MSRTMDPMATKKATKKGTKKTQAAVRKQSLPTRPAKKGATRPAKKAAAAKKAALRPAKKAAARPAKKASARPAKRTAGRPAPTPKAARKASPQVAAKKATRAVASGRAAKTVLHREDRPGHLDPRYVAKLREQSGETERGPRAFIESPRSPGDDLAEELGEEAVERATSGEDEEEALEEIVPEEQGGPFVETNAAQEFAHGIDASNPKGAKREPFPRT
jgi:hypothetical protein